jgi:hypothetical protein
MWKWVIYVLVGERGMVDFRGLVRGRSADCITNKPAVLRRRTEITTIGVEDAVAYDVSHDTSFDALLPLTPIADPITGDAAKTFSV